MRETWASTIAAIKADAAKYPKLLRHDGFWVLLSYRIRRLRKYGAFYWQFIIPIDLLFAIFKSFFTRVSIPASVDIGKGFYLAHADGVIINDMSKIGNDVCIFQQVTLGEWRGKAPVLEDGVHLFAGCKVFGDVTIGKGSKVGANTVVSRSVPPMTTVFPAENRSKPLV